MKPLPHSQPADAGGGRALGPRTNPRVLPPFRWHDPVATTDLHGDSWWKMQCRKINPELVPPSLTQFFILRQSQAFILVRFRDPSVVTFSVRGWSKLSKHSGALLRSQPRLVLLIDSKARNPSRISHWSLIPGIKISSWAMSLISVLCIRAQEKSTESAALFSSSSDKSSSITSRHLVTVQRGRLIFSNWISSSGQGRLPAATIRSLKNSPSENDLLRLASFWASLQLTFVTDSWTAVWFLKLMSGS